MHAGLTSRCTTQIEHASVYIRALHFPRFPVQFREEMVRLCEHTGKKAAGGRQTLLVSATLTPRVLQMCGPWCPSPRQVFVGVTPAAAAAAEAEAAAAVAGQAAERADRAERAQQAQSGEAAEEARERRPAWGWGDAKAPSADAADYFPGQSRRLRGEMLGCASRETAGTHECGGVQACAGAANDCPSHPRGFVLLLPHVSAAHAFLLQPAPLQMQAPRALAAWAAREPLLSPCRPTCATTLWPPPRSTRWTRCGESLSKFHSLLSQSVAASFRLCLCASSTHVRLMLLCPFWKKESMQQVCSTACASLAGHQPPLCTTASWMYECRRSIHAMGVQRALVFMNFQQRLKDTGRARFG